MTAAAQGRTRVQLKLLDGLKAYTDCVVASVGDDLLFLRQRHPLECLSIEKKNLRVQAQLLETRDGWCTW